MVDLCMCVCVAFLKIFVTKNTIITLKNESKKEKYLIIQDNNEQCARICS